MLEQKNYEEVYNLVELPEDYSKETSRESLNKIKFNENLQFDLPISKSIYSNSDKIVSESVLADNGYGQGQILVTPIHMASIYSAFANEGNMIEPYLNNIIGMLFSIPIIMPNHILQ